MYRVKTGVLGSLVALAIGCGGLESRVEPAPVESVKEHDILGQLRFQRKTYTMQGQYHDEMTFVVEFHALDGNVERHTDNFMKSTLVHAQFKRGHLHWYTDNFGRLTRISKKYRSEYKHREIHKGSDAYESADEMLGWLRDNEKSPECKQITRVTWVSWMDYIFVEKY